MSVDKFIIIFFLAAIIVLNLDNSYAQQAGERMIEVKPPVIGESDDEIVVPPSDPDSDGDGIKDSVDQCDYEKETVNDYQDTDGCPDMVSDTMIEPEVTTTTPPPTCEAGTHAENGICVSDKKTTGGPGQCAIATAAYGTELAPQVQLFREVRDNVLFSTGSGVTFMAGFNEFYYTFSPTVADLQRQNPAFNEIVKVTITPMLSTMSILNYANIDSEQEMLGYGIGVLLLNIGMYFVFPAIVIVKLGQKFRKINF